MPRKVLVIKLGTAVISNKEGDIDEDVVKKVADEVALLRKTYHIVIVSSGAVGSGKKYLKDYKGSLSERKAAAAVGNPINPGIFLPNFNPYFRQRRSLIHPPRKTPAAMPK